MVKRDTLLATATFLAWFAAALAQDGSWRHSGSLYILTTPDGANLPPSASVDGFPLLVRLDKDFFDFTQAGPHGEDIRFATPAGASLPYQVEQWDPANGTARIWVRIPTIKGNARQEIRMRWGNPGAANGIAALTFCDVAIEQPKQAP